MESEEKKSILLTFDVEDWFQVENFKDYIPFVSWNNHELRVEKNVHLILDLLDSFKFNPKATFFILGWIAKRLPHLILEIEKRGHEIASHGIDHHLCTKQLKKDLIQDLQKSKQLLEDMIGKQIFGYRAPSFAINNDILDVIKEAGYLYDSSYNSFSMHGRYGSIDLPYKKFKTIYEISNDFFEIPISNLKIKNKVFPLGGGGYFRLFPLLFFKYGMNILLKKEDAFVFYCHPWEFDPRQPRVKEATGAFKFRHYINLSKTADKLEKLIKSFSKFEYQTCKVFLLETINRNIKN